MVNVDLRPLFYKKTDSKHFDFINLMVHDIPSVEGLLTGKNCICVQD